MKTREQMMIEVDAKFREIFGAASAKLPTPRDDGAVKREAFLSRKAARDAALKAAMTPKR